MMGQDNIYLKGHSKSPRGFRRAGLAFAQEESFVRVDEETAKRLEAEPALVVERVSSPPADKKAVADYEADARKTSGEQSKEERDQQTELLKNAEFPQEGGTGKSPPADPLAGVPTTSSTPGGDVGPQDLSAQQDPVPPVSEPNPSAAPPKVEEQKSETVVGTPGGFFHRGKKEK